MRGKTSDSGLDGVGVPRGKLVSFQTYLQCKKWKGAWGQKKFKTSEGRCKVELTKGYSQPREGSRARQMMERHETVPLPSTSLTTTGRVIC
ncbi:hypothetical protein ROBYS_30680 [Roseobacter sp. OBYS 0001]|nr:hypothetical protein ROBYS_30680 [Roseobacter sp. OBYS 0001]